jgi:hypothetical protein
MQEGLQKTFDGPAVEALTVQPHSVYQTRGGLVVDRICQLDFTTCAGCLSTQHLENIWRQELATD